ncbi:MAG: chemotaxis response regulator protein-glutamate methylesterase [Rhodoferax sp.]|nr:chemotaxis response regulator protein-glutamate methylesterase [Rhodoferax sp.]
MVVDDSAVVRQVLRGVVDGDPGMVCMGAHADPVFAQQAMDREWPDVVLLDIEMPRMDGITFLRRLMASRPTPVVVCSTLTARGAPLTLEALDAGAVEVVQKPTTSVRDGLQEQAAALLAAVRMAARANLGSMARARARAAAPRERPEGASAVSVATGGALAETTDRIVAIGTSTGGTVALEIVLRELPVTCPGIVVVQHMPQAYTEAFAERLDRCCAIRVRQATDGERVLPGQALIAPGGRHLQVRRQGGYYHAVVRDGPPVSRHRPSVNVLFGSVAQQAGRNAVGILMTGMGDDGARGLLEMHEAGARTYAQDERSCVVFGMPREAIRMGAVDEVLPLERLHEAVLSRSRPRVSA